MILLVVGPRRHGVVEFGLELADALRCNGFGRATHVTDAKDLRWPAQMRGLHLQFTDRLFGPTPAAAADTVCAIVGEAAARGTRVTATLHDVPQAGDGEHFIRRVGAYAAVCAALYGVVVNSRHERLLLSNIGINPQRIAMVPLPIRAAPVTTPTVAVSPSVGVFGFLYPGKGHVEVMAALEDLDPCIGMVAIGEPSAGHDHLVADLKELGRQQGRRVCITGHVPDDQLQQTLSQVTVPVAHHRHVSASGSLNAWLAVGRRPLASANRYTREMHERNPGAFVLYEDDEAALREAIRRALAEPELTWLPVGTSVTPTVAEAADQYERLLTCWHR